MASASGSLTLKNVSGGAGWYHRFGKVVVVFVDGIKLSSELASGSSVEILTSYPSGCVPNATYINVVGSANASLCGRLDVYVNSSAIKIRNWSGITVPTGSFMGFSITYIAS